MKKNNIALTFDDGPNPFWTEKVLGILEKYNVRATFYLIGKWAKNYPEIVKRILQEGHLIGNHSYSHVKDLDDFEKAERVFKKITGINVKLKKCPYDILGYDVNSLDYVDLSSSAITSRVLEETKKGSIIMFHDGSEEEKEMEERPKEMVKALPEIIERLKEKFNIIRSDQL